MANDALRRYDEACERFHQRHDGEPEGIAETWAALPLRTRLRIVLVPAWREALHEIRHHWKA